MNRVAAISTLLVLPSVLAAVYAPIPPMEQGQALTVTVDGGLSYDDNIFGSSANEISSWIARVSPTLAYNQSLSDQSFLSLHYRIDAMYYDNRPSDDTLFNHDLGAKLFYTFDENTELVVSNTLLFVDNPASSPSPTVSLQTDQSSMNNTFQAKLTGMVSETFGFAGKLRHFYISYDNQSLANLLDREEWLLGAEAFFKQSETTKLVAEVRLNDVSYDIASQVDSTSIFLLVGADYDVTQRSSLSTRIGAERRDRALLAGDDTNFYGEIAGVHRYAEGSFFSGGIRFSTTDTDDTFNYSDQDTLLFFANVQHMVSANLTLSGAASYAKADLNSRADRAVAGIEDTSFRIGVAATYMVSDNLSVSATVDIDRLRSDDFFREQDRTRFGISARYVFGIAN